MASRCHLALRLHVLSVLLHFGYAQTPYVATSLLFLSPSARSQIAIDSSKNGTSLTSSVSQSGVTTASSDFPASSPVASYSSTTATTSSAHTSNVTTKNASPSPQEKISNSTTHSNSATTSDSTTHSTYSPSLPTTAPICQRFNVTHALLSSNQTVVGTQVKITCEEGYVYRDGNTTRTCYTNGPTENATWSGTSGRCLKQPEQPENCRSSMQSRDSIKLSWIPSNANLTDYYITFHDKTIKCTSNLQNKSSCDVTGLLNNTEYQFNITSIKKYQCRSYTCEVISEPCTVCTRTAPPGPVNVHFSNYSETSLVVSWNSIDANTSFISYAVELSDSQHRTVHNTNTSDPVHKFHNLTSGTQYTVNITAVFDGDTCNTSQRLHSKPTSNSTFTKPTPVQSITVLATSVSSISLQLNIDDDRFSSVWLNIKNSTSNCSSTTVPSNIIWNVTCTGLDAMTTYIVEVQTRAGNISGDTYTARVSTKPEKPENCRSSMQSSDSVKLSWIPSSANLTDYYIAYHERKIRCTSNLQKNSSYNVTGLLSNSEYQFNITSIKQYQCRSNMCEVISDPCTVCTRTAPTRPVNVHFSNYSETSFVVSWNSIDANTSFISYTVELSDSQHRTVHNTSDPVHKFHNLTSGTQYTVNITAVFDGNTCNTSQRLHSKPTFNSTFTKPTPVQSITVLAASVSSISLQLNIDDKRFSSVWLNIRTSASNCSSTIVPPNIIRNVTCTGLDAMTSYMVEVHTRAGNISGDTYTARINTSPITPTASVIRVGRTSITINLNVEMGLNPNLTYYYLLSTRNESILTNTTMSPKEFDIGDLIPGTYYIIKIYSSLFGWPCERPWSQGNYTVPSMVSHVAVQPISSTALNISWAKGNGSNEYFIVDYYSCSSPDDGNQSVTEDNTSQLFVVKAGLLPGTYCNVSVTAHAGTQASDRQFSTSASRTFETAPSKVTYLRIDKVFNESHNLAASWSPPSVRNGIIRAYIVTVVVLQQGRCISKYYVNCTDCMEAESNHCDEEMQQKKLQTEEKQPTMLQTDKDECNLHHKTFIASSTKLRLDIDSLLPYTNYTVSVSAVTSCKGPVEHDWNTTDEDVPEAPGSPTLLSKTSDTLYFEWTKPKVPNGIIQEYMIIYEYYERVCRGYGNKTSANKTITYFKQDNINAAKNISYDLDKLYPFWNYTITIKARTSKGYGSASVNGTYITDESEPGIVNRSEINMAPEAYAINLTWKSPCFSNGDIVYYNITWFNVNRASDKRSNTSQTAHMMFTDVLPYRNYSFQIAAVNNKSQGQYTDEYQVQSKIAEPFPPNNIKVDALTSTKVNVSWDLLRDELYTGPTSYTARAHDNNNNSLVYSCDAEGYNATSCEIGELDQYWNYTVDVIAYTRDSSTTYERKSEIVQAVTTKEDRPGSVIDVQAVPERDVKKPRSITVSWQKPHLRDLNGILTDYFVTYHLNNSEFVEILSVVADKTKVVLQGDIKPGAYNIKVFAATKAGNGSAQTPLKDIIVLPGAPIKPEETTVNQLVQKASNKDLDSQTQLAVFLNRQAFLCNSTNGMPTMWGVIVAQSSEAKGTPFNGLRNDYQGVLSKYKKWFEIKDSDNIEPYRATGDAWNPSCSIPGPRSRRSTNVSTSKQLSPLEFIVGKDEDCEERNTGFCNGKLPPGRSFRVKTFVCTDGGCTETEYSTPIKTDKRLSLPESASNPTVAIVAGVVSGIVVVACFLIVVYLKRREKLCFAKTVEDPIFEPELELKGTTKFRPVVVKLADFPAYVDAMHRDSGLLFADGFRLLKEQSPSHDTSVAEIQACRPKTRYTNILPFDHSRVKLLPLDDEEGSDFINANFIPGYTSRREYIATQGPMPATKDDFWRMVWEQNVDIIVMLTRCVEKGKRKCDEYWPEVVQEPIYSGDLILNVQSESTLSDYVIRIIEIKLKEQTRTVRQFAYLKWPDMGSPDDSTMLLSFVKAVRQLIKPGNTSPMIVHCSAGVGRTGTFIAVDRLLQHIRDHDDVDVYSTILDMRNYRCNMVQTEDQFVYIYECIKDFITTDDEEDQEEEDDDHLYENTSYGDNVYENTAFQRE